MGSRVEEEGTSQEVWDQIWNSFVCLTEEFGLCSLITMVCNHYLGCYLKTVSRSSPVYRDTVLGVWPNAPQVIFMCSLGCYC